MKRTVAIQRSILSLGTAIAAIAPMRGIAHGSSLARPGTLRSAATAQTFKGTTEQMQQWGPIRVSIAVTSKKISKVIVSATAHTGRSVSIQSNALPLLKAETLKAQSAMIQEVSGATDTSGAYITSLQSAIKKAKTAKALQ
jgi:uncharacterized protein with FMN-binding domain